ncbi:hypothetical protein LDENG_00211670 [Lucifuga dentata]|nr:hypothetical protein LDENG_00211670 [Lucifuga dentata]
MTVLKDFGKIFGYKINLQKSELMPINNKAQELDLTIFPFKLCKQKFKYLGIWIPLQFKDLYKVNFPPLLKNLTADIKSWSLLSFSLGGRINIIKMSVLPRFLYLFQCLPILLTKTFFLNIDKIISSFIWNHKNPRIRKNILQKHSREGGFGLPNLRYYYWAANIRALLYWMNYSPGTAPKWVILENSSCSSSSICLQALLCTKLPLAEPISKFSLNPIVKHSFTIWSQFR